MLELGNDSGLAHKEVLDLLLKNELETVLCVGPIFGALAEEYPFHFFDSLHEAKAYWQQINLKGYKVLVKGSRAMGLEQLIDPSPAT